MTLSNHQKYIDGGIIWKASILSGLTGLLKNYQSISQKLPKPMAFPFPI